MSGTPVKGRAFTLNNTVPPKDEKVLSLFSCRGKTAIVTGAADGIGLTVAHALAEAGANVAIWYNSNKKAIDRASEIEEEYGIKCKAYHVDVTKENQVMESVDTAVDDFNGRLDIFVANAGTFPDGGGIVDIDIESYRKCMATNLDSTIYCARAAGKHFRRQKIENRLEGFTYGKFVTTASIAGGNFMELPDTVASYAIAKAGVIQLCKSLAVEWIQFARVNSVSPGTFTTPIVESFPEETRNIYRAGCPMGREGAPHELKGIYMYLCSDASSFTTGSNFIVDGGSAVI